MLVKGSSTVVLSTSKDPSKKWRYFRVTRDHVPRRARAFRGWIERKHYWIGNTAEWLIGMQWCIAIYTWSWRVPVVGLWRIFRLKQTIGMQGERPIYSSLDGMQKKPTFPDKGGYRALTEWKSSWCPLFVCLLASSPLKTRLEIRDPIRANSFRLQTGRVTHVLFLTPKGHLSIVAHRLFQASMQLMGQCKAMGGRLPNDSSTLSLRLRFRLDAQLTILATTSRIIAANQLFLYFVFVKKSYLFKRIWILFSILLIKYYFSSFASLIFGRKFWKMFYDVFDLFEIDNTPCGNVIFIQKSELMLSIS